MGNVAEGTPTSPSPAPGPVGKIQQDYGIDLPSWLVWLLSVFGALAALAVLYKPLGPPVLGLWRFSSAVAKSRRQKAKRARRRAMFADHLENAMRRLAEKEEWRDSRFAQLEAEVEMERESMLGRVRRLFAGVRSPRIRRVRSLTAALRKSSERLVVLEGDPGSGKSVALRHLAQQMASAASRRPSDRTIFPIYVNLKAFRPEHDRRVSAEDVREFVLASLNPAQSGDIDRFLDNEFERGCEEGRWLFLFDSFDETPSILSAAEAGPIIDEYADAISGFLGVGSSRGIIASREFRGPSRMGWPRFRVVPLTWRRRIALIKRADLDTREESLLRGELGTPEFNARQFADNPLFLGLLCEYVRETGTAPESSHAVMENYVRSRLIRDRERIERRFAVSVETARAFAEEMAFQMLAAPELGLSTSKGRIVATVAGELGRDTDESMAALDALIYGKLVRLTDDKIVSSPEEAPVTFSHRRLQEYFATCLVIRERHRIALRELLTNGRWRETAVAVLQTQSSEDSAPLLDEVEALLRSHSAGIWPTGVLHILDLLASGLKPEQTAGVGAGAVADEILENAWENGSRLDRKWVVELCAAAGTERAVEYLTRAFNTSSQWLRNEAYLQVRRVGAAASQLEPHIRQVLVDISIGGGLRRNYRSVRAQLLRLSNPKPLQRTTELLLLAPVVAVVSFTLFFMLSYMQSRMTYQSWADGAVVLVGAVCALLATLLRRFSMVSDSRAQHHARGFLSRVGRGSGVGNKAAAAFLSGILFVFLTLFMTLSIADTLVDKLELDVTVSFGSAFVIAVWIASWPGAAFVAAKSGVWSERRYWMVLPLYFTKQALRWVRTKPVVSVGWLTGLAILMVASNYLGEYLDRFPADSLWPYVNTASVLLFVALPAFLALRRAYLRAIDSRGVSAFRKSDPELPEARALQQVLHRLGTDEGVRLLLQDVQKRELQRDDAIVEFLTFLSLRLEGSSEEAPVNFATWWTTYENKDGRKPLMEPSSETLDELARVLEDVKRPHAFHG